VEDIKRIITRAVYGNRIQTVRNTVRIAAGEPEKIKEVLGCAVNGARILDASIEEDVTKGKKVRVNAELEIHIWYRTDSDTKVYRTITETSDIVEVEKQGAERFSHEDVKMWMKEKPKCVGAALVSEKEGDLVAVELEYVLEAEIIGETLLNVKVYKT
jgi:hypothetical protein